MLGKPSHDAFTSQPEPCVIVQRRPQAGQLQQRWANREAGDRPICAVARVAKFASAARRAALATLAIAAARFTSPTAGSRTLATLRHACRCAHPTHRRVVHRTLHRPHIRHVAVDIL